MRSPQPPGTDPDTMGTARRATRPPRKRAKRGQRAREARELVQSLNEARKARRESWPEGQSEFATVRQENRLAELHGEKRAMRREVYAVAPELEGADVRKQHPGADR